MIEGLCGEDGGGIWVDEVGVNSGEDHWRMSLTLNTIKSIQNVELTLNNKVRVTGIDSIRGSKWSKFGEVDDLVHDLALLTIESALNRIAQSSQSN
jgi:hypothetical protein